MAWMTLEITDGTTTINLVDGINYNLVSWAPQVAVKQMGVLGGRSRYANVIEEITFNMFGSSIYDNYTTLTNMLDNADNGETNVTIRCQPQGSALANPLEARIVGTGNGGGIFLPATFFGFMLIEEVNGVTIRFERTGLWLGELDAASDTGTGNPEILSVTMAEELSIPGPTKVTFTGFGSTGDLQHGAWAVTDNGSTEFQILECESMTGDGTSTTDPSGTAVGGNVRRFVSTTVDTQTITSTVSITDVETIQLLCMARQFTNTDPAESFMIRGFSATEELSGSRKYIYSRWFHMDAADKIRLYDFGQFSHPIGKHTYVGVEVSSIDDVDTNNYAYLDYLVVVPVSENTRIAPIALGWGITTSSDIVYDHRTLTADKPLAYFANTSTGAALETMTARSADYLETAGDTLQFVFMAREDNDYYFVGDSISVEVERYKAFLVPQ